MLYPETTLKYLAFNGSVFNIPTTLSFNKTYIDVLNKASGNINPPTSVILQPVQNRFYNSLTNISGTAFDNKYGYNLQKEVERSYRIIPLEGEGKGKIGKNKNYEGAIKDFNQKFHKDPHTIPVKVEIHAKYKITAKEKKEAKVEGSASPGSYHTNETNIEMVI